MVTLTQEEYEILKIYQDTMEWQRYTAIEQGLTRYLTNKSHEELLGKREEWFPYNAPDWFILDATRRYVVDHQKADARINIYQGRVAIGEETIEGWAYDGSTDWWKHSVSGLADISPYGRASVIGKIAEELCRRMEAELDADRRAEEYAPWTPPE